MSDADADARVARRLSARPEADCWTAVCVRIVPSASRSEGERVVHTPEHFLAAAWAPPVHGPARWPEAVVIGSPTPTRTLEGLLAQLPPGAKLFLAGLDDVDAALAAEILLAGDRNLERYQCEAIGAFVAAERERVRASIAGRYTDRDAGFERFRARVLGAAPR